MIINKPPQCNYMCKGSSYYWSRTIRGCYTWSGTSYRSYKRSPGPTIVAIVGPLAGGLTMAGAVQLWQPQMVRGTICGKDKRSRTDSGWDQLARDRFFNCCMGLSTYCSVQHYGFYTLCMYTMQDFALQWFHCYNEIIITTAWFQIFQTCNFKSRFRHFFHVLKFD